MAALATTAAVAKRLGRPLTEGDETNHVEFLLDAASSFIADAVGKGDAWVEETADDDEAPKILGILTVELVVRVLGNPEGLRSAQKQLGSFSTSKTFNTEALGLELKPSERALVRRTVLGRTSGSAVVSSVVETCD